MLSNVVFLSFFVWKSASLIYPPPLSAFWKWTNFIKGNKAWAKFSTLNVAVCIIYALRVSINREKSFGKLNKRVEHFSCHLCPHSAIFWINLAFTFPFIPIPYPCPSPIQRQITIGINSGRLVLLELLASVYFWWIMLLTTKNYIKNLLPQNSNYCDISAA